MTDTNLRPTDDSNLYFDLQADFGLTKHMGGRKATRELADLCQIGKDSSVLEIGCGVGYSAVYLAREYGCRVTSIDINEGMVLRARERARKAGLTGQVTFEPADAQQLPFETGTFDAVIDESVTAFIPDKLKAVREYMRVAKSGGYVGMNEVAWAQPPSPELVQYASLIMAGAVFLTSAGWEELFIDAGLQEVVAHNHKFSRTEQWRSDLETLDFHEYTHAWSRFLSQSLTNPAYRKFTRQVMSAPRNIFKFLACIGYGIYVGKVP